ncbi:MAG: hypothetical protein PVI78_12150 [Anaerolineales bacterium]|jgi:hypothetical protein
MRNAQFIGGILLLAVAIVIFLALDTAASVPVAITCTVVGVVLIATSRRRSA